uniref:Uncharacterized protein n=1 Tax=Romanomermis culicivorax TaxID=13658 RepID=A0A915JDL9_ROMCU
METILKDIETALGYTDDPRHTFTITNSKTSLAIATKIEMSAHAFCAAILELVPFKKEDMEKSMT